jgi:3-isopropylmalate/(R)-2-methylmalate dehydratase small subunit
LKTSTLTRSSPHVFLKATSRDGFGENLFRDWRFNNNDEKQPKADFVLNNPTYSGKILVAAKNFGCVPQGNMRPGPLRIMDLMWVVSSFSRTSSKTMRRIIFLSLYK